MLVLILRKCTEGRTSHDKQFIYPERGYVEAPDWNGKPECGRGLHGLLWGHGSFNLEPFGTIFQVIEAESENVIEFDGKCKFKCGNVIYTGGQLGAVKLLKEHPNYPEDNILNYDITDNQFTVSGDRSTQTAGDESTQTAGYRSTQTAGDESTQTAGYGSTQTAGYGSTQTAGEKSVQICYWFDNQGNYQISVRKVTKAMANKPYKFKQGKWSLLKE